MAERRPQAELRAARNQALYREINEKMETVNEAFDELLDVGSSWVCECANRDCTEPMQLTVAEYEAVRAHANRFAVLPGHVCPDVERVVEEHESYLIVEKLGAGSDFAVEHDPRAPSSAD